MRSFSAEEKLIHTTMISISAGEKMNAYKGYFLFQPKKNMNAYKSDFFFSRKRCMNIKVTSFLTKKKKLCPEVIAILACE